MMFLSVTAFSSILNDLVQIFADFLTGKTSLTVFQNFSGLDRLSSSLFLKKFRFVRFIKFVTKFFCLRYAFQSGSSFDFWAFRSNLSRAFMCCFTSASSHDDGLPFHFF